MNNTMVTLAPENDGMINDNNFVVIGQKQHEEIKSKIINTLDQSTINEIYGDEDKILWFLATKCLDMKMGVTEYGEEGIHYSLTFPTVNGFSCKKLDRFVSRRSVSREEYENNEEWKEKSSSIEDLSAKLFELMRDFLKALGVSKDENVDYVKYMFENERCGIGESVKYATDSELRYWTSSKKEDHRVIWYCFFDYCKFSLSDSSAFLLLGLSVLDGD